MYCSAIHLLLHWILDDEEKSLSFNTDEINIYSATHQFQLARALNVLHVKASTFHSFYTTGKFDKVRNLINDFRAGNVAEFLPAWEAITSDKEILSAISGLTIDHEGLVLGSFPRKCNFSKSDTALIDTEIEKLLKKGVISPCEKEEDDFFSPIFLKEKQDKSHRMILNLKKLNKETNKIHFKMDTIYSIKNLISKGMYFVKIDISDAYYSIKINSKDTKYLKFSHRGKFYKFLVLPNVKFPSLNYARRV